MNSISFEGFNAQYLTFKKASSAVLNKGDFVSIDRDYTVKKFVPSEAIVGKCVDIRGDFVTVQVSGYMTAPIASAQKIPYGYTALTLNTSGEVIASAASATRCVLVVEIIDSQTVGFIL